MPDVVFPTFPGAGFVKRTSRHNNQVQTAASGREVRIVLWSYPKYEWEIPLNFIKTDVGQQFQTLVGLFNQMHGNYGTFLYSDYYDNSVTSQAIGTGDSLTTTFQLVRTFGGFTEPIYDVNSSVAAPNIYLNGVLKATPGDYSIGTTGIITFTSAPGSGVAITADFSYYFRVRFKESEQEYQEFISNIFEAKRVTILTANK